MGPLPTGLSLHGGYKWGGTSDHHVSVRPAMILQAPSKKDRGAKAIIKKSSTVKPGQDLGPLLKVELLVGYIRSCQVKGWLVNLRLLCVLRPHFSGLQLVSFPPKPRVFKGFFLGIPKDLPRNHRQQDMQFGLSRRARCRRPTKWEYAEGWASGRWKFKVSVRMFQPGKSHRDSKAYTYWYIIWI